MDRRGFFGKIVAAIVAGLGWKAKEPVPVGQPLTPNEARAYVCFVGENGRHATGWTKLPDGKQLLIVGESPWLTANEIREIAKKYNL